MIPRSAALVVLTFVAAGTGAYAQDSRPVTAAVAAVERMTDPKSLAIIATGGGDRDARIAAIKKISDQEVLTTIARSEGPDNVRAAAIERVTNNDVIVDIAMREKPGAVVTQALMRRLTDAAVLAGIARGAAAESMRQAAINHPSVFDLEVLTAATADEAKVVRDAAQRKLDITDRATAAKAENVRRMAVHALTDPALLRRIATDPKEKPSIRGAALGNKYLIDHSLLAEMTASRDMYERRGAVSNPSLDDQPLFERLAINDADFNVREAALLRLKNQAVIGQVATSDPDKSVRNMATRRVTDPAVLADIATNEREETTRTLAVKSPLLTDQNVLGRVATNDPDSRIREAAVVKLQDPDALARVATTDRSANVRRLALPKVTDSAALATVALEDKEAGNRSLALKNKHLVDEAILVRVAETDRNALVRVDAVRKVKDQAHLVRFATTDKEDVVRAAAAALVRDQEVLASLATGDKSPRVRGAAARNLTDVTKLELITKGDADAGVRISAEAALAELELLETMTPENRASWIAQRDVRKLAAVHDLALVYIKRGDPVRIPRLVQLLSWGGTKSMAEDYLNCGQADLATAARAWASRNGYRILTIGSGSRVRWGSDRVKRLPTATTR